MARPNRYPKQFSCARCGQFLSYHASEALRGIPLPLCGERCFPKGWDDPPAFDSLHHKMPDRWRG